MDLPLEGSGADGLGQSVTPSFFPCAYVCFDFAFGFYALISNVARCL